ncbi:MAG: hypothetical protein WBE26_20375 [Phycisphaerae bacterium]
MPKVLVVDDEKSFAEPAAAELRHAGFEADVARTYTEAIERLESSGYDIVSLDIMMRIERDEKLDPRQAARAEHGKLTGLLIYDTVHERWPDVNVVVCSVFGGDEQGREAIRCVQKAGVRILAKPVTIAEYVSAIRLAAGLSQS